MQLVISEDHFKALAAMPGEEISLFSYHFSQLKNANALVLSHQGQFYFFTVTARELPDNYKIYALIMQSFNPEELNEEYALKKVADGKLENIQFYKQMHHLMRENSDTLELEVEAAILIELDDSRKWMLLPEPEEESDCEIITETDDILDNIRRVQLSFSRSVKGS